LIQFAYKECCILFPLVWFISNCFSF